MRHNALNVSSQLEPDPQMMLNEPIVPFGHLNGHFLGHYMMQFFSSVHDVYSIAEASFQVTHFSSRCHLFPSLAFEDDETLGHPCDIPFRLTRFCISMATIWYLQAGSERRKSE